MHAIGSQQFLSRWKAVQFDLIPALQGELGAMTPKLEQLIHVLEWVRIEEYVDATWIGIGRPPAQRAWFANAFVAKAILGIGTTVGLIERLRVDRALRRLCGFCMHRRLPSEATFSRAFAEFAQTQLAERVHEALIKEHLGDVLIGHLSRDGTAIVARERPQAKAARPKRCGRRGRPRAGQKPPAPPSPVAQQRQQTLEEMRHNIPTACDRGTKCNAQGYKISWNGYKLHIDTADCGVPIAAMLSSASMHDSLAAIPLSHRSAQRVTNLYDLMDAAYCSEDIRAHCRSLGHVPLIDHNPRRGQKIPFDPPQAVRYRERTAAERTNARLKDEFGGNTLRVQGAQKVASHLMFGILVLAADQLMRLRH